MKTTWTRETVTAIYERPFIDLVFAAQTIHREHFNPNEIECNTLLSIKTGSCTEDCAYCPQSAHYQTDIQRERLLDNDIIAAQALLAKKNGATRFCMGASWRDLPDKHLPAVVKAIETAKKIGLETCTTLGMLTKTQAETLKSAGLDYYNHNLDTSAQHYPAIVTTHTYQERLDTIKHVQEAGIHVCCGGILGLGETREDRIDFLIQLANLDQPPQSVPINQLIPIPGTPLTDHKTIDPFEFIRAIATARIMMPTSRIRLSAGRDNMSNEMHALCFMAGANSIFLGDTLLTAPNPSAENDMMLLNKLGMHTRKTSADDCANAH